MKEIKTVTKVYTLRNFGGGAFEVKWCGQTLRLEFIAGRGAVGSKRSVLTVADKFTQDAIENDARFGKLITLDSVYGDAEEGTATIEKPVVQPVVRYTRKQLEAMKAKEESISADEQKTEDEKPEKKATRKKGNKSQNVGEGTAERNGESFGGETAEHDRGEGVKEDEVKKVEGVKSLNDAYDYFAEKGKVVENEKELEEAMKAEKVAFPNLVK